MNRSILARIILVHRTQKENDPGAPGSSSKQRIESICEKLIATRGVVGAGAQSRQQSRSTRPGIATGRLAAGIGRRRTTSCGARRHGYAATNALISRVGNTDAAATAAGIHTCRHAIACHGYTTHHRLIGRATRRFTARRLTAGIARAAIPTAQAIGVRYVGPGQQSDKQSGKQHSIHWSLLTKNRVILWASSIWTHHLSPSTTRSEHDTNSIAVENRVRS